MAFFDYKGMKIHYQIEGSGKPLLLLNGIMMTVQSWEPVMEPLKAHNQVIRLDLLDQGLSEKQTNNYTIDDQADLVYAFVKHLGIEPIDAVGISYGGYIGLNLATRYPDFFDRLVIFHSSARSDERERDMVFRQFARLADIGDPYAFYLGTVPLFYSATFYDNETEWMKKREKLLVDFFKSDEYRESVKRLAISCLSHDLDSELHKIKCNVLIVNGEEDYIFARPRQQFLMDNIKGAQLISIAKTGHVSPYENPIIFTSIIYGYINNPTFKFEI